MESSNLRNKILLISILIPTGIIALVGCARYDLFIPEYNDFNPPPEEITLEQLQIDYNANEVIADAKYKGEKLLVNEVEVEQVDSHWYYRNLKWIFEKNYFISGSVKFRLRGEDYGIMQAIKEGYVLNIVGDCRGLVSGGYGEEPLILMDNCWVESVSGELLSNTWEPPQY